MSIFGNPPRDISVTNTLGFVPSSKTGVNGTLKLSEQEAKFVKVSNCANIAGYILSPIVGLIRIIVSAYFIHADRKNENTEGQSAYLNSQLLRGVAELFGGGYVLWIPDVVATLAHFDKITIPNKIFGVKLL